MAKHKHVFAVETDEPEVNLQIGGGGAPGGWWFKVFHSWIDSGWWAAMTPAAAKVLIVLAKHANQERLCWPGLSLLAQETGLERASIYAALNQLEAFTLVARRVRGYGNKKTVYEILEPTKSPVQKPGQSKATDRSARMDNPVRAAGKSDKPAAESNLLESRLLEGNRSTSEQRIKTTGKVEGDDEVESWAKALTEDECQAAKEVVLKNASSEERMLLAKSTIRSSRTLRARAYAIFHPPAKSGGRMARLD